MAEDTARRRVEILDVLDVGECEPLKAGVHGLLMVVASVCAIYNTAAWMKRRERHLGFNAVVYAAAALWEYKHVLQHLACRPAAAPSGLGPLRDAA